MSRLLVIASLALLTQAGLAQSSTKHTGQPLNDAAMDRITAAGVSASASNGIVTFQGSQMTPNGLVTMLRPSAACRLRILRWKRLRSSSQYA
jgi:hypothetical protein